MTTAVVGAGPTGLVLATALAQRGERVVLVDPDVGPGPDGPWMRRGVMQFRHPHFFRHIVRGLLETHVPQMWDAVVAAGGVVNEPAEGLPPFMTTLACRRSTYEAALRSVAQHELLSFLPGYAEHVVVEGGRVTGVVVDGVTVEADRVVMAGGRASRLGDDLRPEGEGGACGLSYVSRMYRALPGVEPLRSWMPLGKQYDGYQAIVFPQDAGTHSVLVVRPAADPALEALWQTPAFDAAVPHVPLLAPWTDPDRFEPITDPMRGGTLTNTYRGQGTPPAGAFFVGDAVCTTNPSAGRGVGLGLRQVGALLAALDEHADPRDASAAFDAWCTADVRPWYEDHVRDDAWELARYAGERFDVEAPLPSAVVGWALAELPHLMPVVGPYLGMMALPPSLEPVHEEVRALLRTGWRPPFAAGPSAAELAELVGARV
jgi:2-polyprenyl-6-methoxyphenol hydroxylase-like FAD-dependent oxidoreductase